MIKKLLSLCLILASIQGQTPYFSGVGRTITGLHITNAAAEDTTIENGMSYTYVTPPVFLAGPLWTIFTPSTTTVSPAFGEGGVYCGGCFEILKIRIPCPGYDIGWALNQKCTLCVEQTIPN